MPPKQRPGKKATCQHYGEPWIARPAPQPEHCTALPEEPIGPKYQAWHVWAKVSDAGTARTIFTGETILVDESWPIITFRRSNAVTLEGLTQQTLAERVAQCVSFCAGVDLSSCGYLSLISCLAVARVGESVEPPTREDFNKLWPLR
jgi:hypothetical protein